jgi:hypothetical protein
MQILEDNLELKSTKSTTETVAGILKIEKSSILPISDTFTIILLFICILVSSKIVIFNLSESAFSEIQSLEDELNAVLSG